MNGTFVWCDAHGRGRNQFVAFRRAFHCDWQPRRCRLHIFADSRYRLSVNGTIVGYGPGRFVPSCPEYDTYDLGRWLRAGDNEVVVLVNHYGANSFQTLPGTVGGFVAWGDEPLGPTPGAWQVQRCAAWDAEAPNFSFAQGPVEIRDLAVELDEAAWRPAVPLADASAWGPLAPRGIPLNDGAEQPLTAIANLALADDEQRLTCRVYAGNVATWRRGPEKTWFAYHCWLHSPGEQEVVLGLFWGPHYVNGVEVTGPDDPVRGNRRNLTASFRAGWNLLYGEVEVLSEVWGLQVGLPRGAGLTPRAAPVLDCPALLAHTAALSQTELERCRPAVPADAESLARLTCAWQLVSADSQPHLPARSLAWDVPGAGAARATVFDCGGEYLGRLVLEVEAPAGTVLDLAYDEQRRPDGLLPLFATNPFIDAVDRYVCAGGRQTVEGFHVRGGRYLQVTARGPATIHRAAVRPANYPFNVVGRFECDDPLFNWIWETGVKTVVACAEDTFLDCPWRERGLYLGDLLVEMQAQRTFDADPRLGARCLRLFAAGRREDGGLPGCVPSPLLGGLGDFTLIWILALRAHWAGTGDLALVRELWPVVGGILDSPSWQASASGLWDGGGFIDWGKTRESAEFAEHGALNAFRYRALICAAELARALGEPAARWDDEARRVAQLYRERLWLGDADGFAAGWQAGQPQRESAIHGNLLALAFGLADESQRPALLRWVCARLAGNVEHALTHGAGSGYAELYFLQYALDALYSHGCVAEAEAVIRSHYAPLRAHGCWTLPECFERGLQNQGSACHGWSAAPLLAFSRRVLGVRPARPGCLDEVVVRPRADSLQWANGVVPHPAGPIKVSWRREGGRLRLGVEAPPGVTISG